MREIHL